MRLFSRVTVTITVSSALELIVTSPMGKRIILVIWNENPYVWFFYPMHWLTPRSYVHEFGFRRALRVRTNKAGRKQDIWIIGGHQDERCKDGNRIDEAIVSTKIDEIKPGIRPMIETVWWIRDIWVRIRFRILLFSYKIMMDPAPVGPITYGSYGSGSRSTTLDRTVCLGMKQWNKDGHQGPPKKSCLRDRWQRQ